MSDLLSKLDKFNQGAGNIARSGYRPLAGPNRSKLIALIIKVDDPGQPDKFSFKWNQKKSGAPAFTVTPKYEMVSDESHRNEQWFGATYTVINLNQDEMDEVVNGIPRVPTTKEEGGDQQKRNEIQVNNLRDYLQTLLGYKVSDTEGGNAATTVAALQDADEQVEAATQSGNPLQVDLVVREYRPGQAGTQWDGKFFFDGEVLKQKVQIAEPVTT